LSAFEKAAVLEGVGFQSPAYPHQESVVSSGLTGSVG